VMFARPLYAR